MAREHKGGQVKGKGQLTVEPIRELDKVKAIKQLTRGEPRDHLLFVLGVNNGIRAADLVRLRCGQLRGLKPGENVQILETKTKKKNYVHVNKAVHKALEHYFAAYPAAPDQGYLFFSKKGGHLGQQAVGDMVARWCKAVGLNRGRYGCHTLRKTWGYHQRTRYGVGWELIAARYNHSSPSITRAYLGIQQDEVTRIMNNEI